jgi:predicted dehydrogenase
MYFAAKRGHLSMKKIRIGLMGTGFMGKAHSHAFHSIPYMFNPKTYEIELAGICASTPESAQKGAERFGFQKAYSSFDEMLNDGAITAFDNAGPDPTHYPTVMQAIGQGKHIYCEKPIAMNSEQAKEMYTAADAAGLIHMAGFNCRFFPANLLARKLIQEGAIGKILHTRFLYDQQYGASEKLKAEDIWYNNVGKADGVGQAIGCHAVDLARFLVGDIVSLSGTSRIYQATRFSRTGEPVTIVGEESSLAHVDFANGATGTLESTMAAMGMPNNLHYEIFGSKGSLMFSLHRPGFLQVYLEDTAVKEVAGFTEVSVTYSSLGHPYAEAYWPMGHNIGWEYGHIAAIAHFLDCVAENAPVHPLGATLYDGYAAEKVLETIKLSSKEGRRLDVKM